MDSVSRLMTRFGLPVEQETMGSSSIVLGRRVQWKNSQLLYKVEDDTLMIICYERVQQQTGLISGFRDLLDWLSTIKREVPDIQYVTGRVESMMSSRSKNTLTTEKLHRFYATIMQTPYAPDLGDNWFRFHLSELRDFRQHYRAKVS